MARSNDGKPLVSQAPAGLILAGGQSRRMGRDKAALPFGAETLLARAVRQMGQVAATLVVSLAPDQTPDPAAAGPSVRFVRDDQAYGGPLPGMLHGFRAVAALRPAPRAVLVMPVDLPFYTPDWMRRALEGLSGHRACLYRYEGFVNALVGAYEVALVAKLEGLVHQPRARPLGLSDGEPTRILEVEALWNPAAGPPPLMDTDTPEDYERALALAGFGAQQDHPPRGRIG
jgi:molybdopterin-guanine dinucleotide biosynthesis protein A